MLVQEELDPVDGITAPEGPAIVHIGRGAPRRWFVKGTSFGISRAPIRQGRVSFSLAPANAAASGWVSLEAHTSDPPRRTGGNSSYFVSVGVRPAGLQQVQAIHATAMGASVVSTDPVGGKALFRIDSAIAGSFNFTFGASW